MIYNNRELSKLISKDYKEYNSYEIYDFLKLFALYVEKLVKNGDTINMESFGKFEPKVNPAKKMFHPKKMQWLDKEETVTLKFTPSRAMIDRLRVEKPKLEEGTE